MGGLTDAAGGPAASLLLLALAFASSAAGYVALSLSIQPVVPACLLASPACLPACLTA